MTWILRILWFFAGQQIRARAARQFKRQGVVAYLRVLQGSRRMLLLGLLAFFVLQLTMIAGIGALVTGVILWDYDFQTKMQILLGIFLFLFLVPMAALSVLFSESVWYRASGAKKMVDEMVEDSGSKKSEAA